MVENDKLLQDLLQEDAMVAVVCEECGQYANLSFEIQADFKGGMDLRGVITCQARDKHRWPITIRTGGIIRSTDQWMPIEESGQLKSTASDIRPDIKQDIQEAEDAYFYQAYKASVIMCRRAVQLSMEHHTGRQGVTLGPLLAYGRQLDPPALRAQTDQFAERIHSLGDEAAHKVTDHRPEEVKVVIHDTVVIVNELLTKPPASLSGTSSNEP